MTASRSLGGGMALSFLLGAVCKAPASISEVASRPGAVANASGSCAWPNAILDPGRRMRDEGYEVLGALDGVQAVASLTDLPRPIVLLVTDFNMPGGLDGAQLASRFRALNPDVPVVIATGRLDVMQRSWREELGCALLRKPYRSSELTELVRALVGAPYGGG